MAFLRDYPTASQAISASQPILKENFNASDDSFGTDHFAFSNTTAQNGTHKQVQLYEGTSVNGTIPAGLKGANYESIYSSLTAGTGELWMVRGASATGVQLTGPGTPTATTAGYSFLPGGILIQWGQKIQAMSSGSNTGTITFSLPFPNKIFVITANPFANFGDLPSSQGSITFRNSEFSTTLNEATWQFYTGSSKYTGFDWIAIGN